MNAFPLALIVLLLAFVSQGAQAHTDHDKARFVAEDGVDAGKCDNRFRPCKTLSYAARQANKATKFSLLKANIISTTLSMHKF